MIKNFVPKRIGVWFPAVRTGTGTDTFTLQLCNALNAQDIRAEISWLPHHTEYLPWTISPPTPPSWANIAHLNTWLHRRFIPESIPVLATMHLCVHDPALRQYKSKAQSIYHFYWIKSMERLLLKRARAVVAVSHYTARRTQEIFQTQDIKVIHNGIHIPPSTGPAIHETGTPFRLLYVGNWSKRKGVDILADLMKLLGPEFELHYTADAHGAHQNYSLPKNCKCIGRLDQKQLYQAYLQANGLIFPSRLEGLPLTVIEAMAHGLPVVAANASSLPELINDGITGLLFPQDDITAAAEAIHRLAAHPDLARNLGVRARDRIKSDFSLESMANAYAKLYRNIVFGY